jgi:hypothetical protein
MITLNGDTGITTPTYGGAVAAEYIAPVTSFKNRLINGSMQIDQRNAGASVSLVVGQFPYTLDRWQAFSTGANTTLQQVSSGVTGIPNVLQITGAASNTSVNVFQKIEAKNCADLAGSTVTLSALISNSLLTTVTWRVSFANSADNFASVTDISTGTFTVNSSLSQYSVQIALPANAANGVQIFLSCANQTSGTFRLTNVQLEKGSTATSFDYRPYGTELALCQRYFWGTGQTLLTGSQPTANLSFPIQHPVPMRVAPTITLDSGLTNANYVAFSPTSANQWNLLQQGINFATKTGTVSIFPTGQSVLYSYIAFINATWSVPINMLIAYNPNIATLSAEL